LSDREVDDTFDSMKGTLHRERRVGAAVQGLMPLLGLLQVIGLIGTTCAAEWEPDLDSEPHRYFQRSAGDRFSRRIPELAEGRLPLDRSSERAFLKSLLRALDIPESSQLLVFSNTSLQLSLINPDNPRALYFSDDLYLGYVPGGKIEVATIDAELGAVFYIFDIPRSDSRVVVERARRCMNCHANEDTLKVPGLSVKSVAPGPGGGSLDTFHPGQSGHTQPLAERFGGWYVTGTGGFNGHWGNRMGRLYQGELSATPLEPGTRFSFERYPVATSDLLAHLLHEHQVGGVNRLIRAQYRFRELRHRNGGSAPQALPPDLETELADLLGYLLFAQEAPLPASGIPGNPAFREAFARNRKEVDGHSLKDLDLQTRLLRFRCSYLIHTPFFDGLDADLRRRILRDLDHALSPGKRNAASRHLSDSEAAVIRTILRATVPGFPNGTAGPV
jgi:hypothetical protein